MRNLPHRFALSKAKIDHCFHSNLTELRGCVNSDGQKSGGEQIASKRALKKSSDYRRNWNSGNWNSRIRPRSVMIAC
ncbi:hypothetical protein CEXT_421881 [Caerostris extrusa]|uniref:Uncharacterized protein n=1 Tax=Caerostris extrusa TaxID=172846 RepID=A0AAV4X311_CAEEX|nr:hypothetical protein CEXT_421881 [Caerostris extrusa]